MRLSDLETAITAFEERSGLLVTVHDLRQTLEPLLRLRRHRHRHPLCGAVKSQYGAVCVDFEITQLRRLVAQHPDGQVHLCHAGLVEWWVPVFRGLELEWILFAGVRTAAPGLRPGRVQRLHPPTRRPWPPLVKLPKPVAQKEAELLLESLRQLAARLWLWRLNWEAAGHIAGDERQPVPANRAMRIYRFLTERHTRPIALADLAETLAVSPSRASHLVRESCGRSFRELLVEQRLQTARDLLRNSAQSILEVALHSGFDEITHFHRIFKRRVGCTPRQYRRSEGT